MLCGSFRLYKLIINRFVSDLYHYVCINMHVAFIKIYIFIAVHEEYNGQLWDYQTQTLIIEEVSDDR